MRPATWLATALVLAGFGSEQAYLQAAAVSVTVTPSTATVLVCATESLTATVANASNTGVTWKVDGVPNGSAAVGTISGSGNTVTYTAPDARANHTITATSVANTAVSASAAISVLTPVVVSWTGPIPPPATLNISGSTLLQATAAVTVPGSLSNALNWTVDGVANGNATTGFITPLASGGGVIYTAPGAAGCHTVTATSAAEHSQSVSATLSVGSTTVQVVKPPVVVNVRNPPYNATGNSVTDDTAAIQAAVNAVAGTGGEVLVPAGTYLVNPCANARAAIRMGSNMTMVLQPGAVLQAACTSTSNFSVIYFSQVTNSSLLGGTIIGNRFNNVITDTDENGMDIQVSGSSNVVLDGVTLTDSWCDGVYICNSSQDITLSNVVCDTSRRHGLSIVQATGVVARGCTFENSTGSIESGVLTNGCGVDVEPNAGQAISTVFFSRCAFTDNVACGISVGSAAAGTSVSGIVIDSSTATGNGTNAAGSTRGIWLTSGPTLNQVSNNIVSNNNGAGIELDDGADSTAIFGNTVTGTLAKQNLSLGKGVGIMLYLTGGNSVTENTVENNQGCGIRDSCPTAVNTLSANTCTNNAGPCS